MAKTRKRYQPGHQARKAEATRNKILDAVVALINESGYGAASSTAISRQARVTWGAVQHHYGDKEEIMLAVLERAQQVYLESMSAADTDHLSLEQKVDLFVDQAWENYRGELYFAFIEIIMANRGEKGRLSINSPQMRALVERQMAAMDGFFRGHRIPKSRIENAVIFTHRFLTGFSVEKVFDPQMRYERSQIRRLKSNVLAILNG